MPYLWIAPIAVLPNGIIGPVGEEVIFRALVFEGAKSRYSAMWANVFQAALFAVKHLDFRIPGILVGELVLGCIKERWGLESSMAAHVTMNSIATAASLFFASSTRRDSFSCEECRSAFCVGVGEERRVVRGFQRDYQLAEN